MTDTTFHRPKPTDAYFAPGEAGQHPFAALYQGEFETLWDGTAVAVRAHARALASSGVPVFLKSFSSIVIDEYGIPQPVHQGGYPDAVLAEVSGLMQTSAESLFPIIKHAVVRDALHLKQLIIPKGAIAQGGLDSEIAMRDAIFGATIFYSVWERDRVDPAIARLLSRCAECWVPSAANRSMLIASGVPPEQIQVIPHPYDPSDPLLKLRRRRPDTEWRKFYSIGRWEPRKGYDALVEAFLRAFTPADKVVLTIKYTGGRWPDYPAPEETLERVRRLPATLQNRWTLSTIRDRVRLIEGRLPRPAILKLHYRNNLYVSSSHGEAWCLPAYEAALAGNSLVYTPAGGIEDFAGDGQVVVESDGPSSVHPSYHWEADAQWCGYSIDALAAALRRAEVPTSHDVAGRIHLERFTLEAVGKQMRERVLALAGKKPAAEAYLRQGPRQPKDA